MSILASLAAWIFVALVYRSDAKNHPKQSGALWLPVLWMMRCGSRGVDNWIGGGENGRLDPIVIAVLLALGFFALLRRPCQWSRIFAHNSAILIFYGYIIASLSWVETLDNPWIKMLRPLGDLIMALLVATDPEPFRAISTLFRRTAILLIPMSVVLVKYYPHLGRAQDKHWGSDPWIGVATHKNPLGQLCMVSAFAFIWSLVQAHRDGKKLRTQRLSWLYLGLTAYLMFCGGEESRSSTSILCLFLAMGLFCIFSFLRKMIQKIMRWMTIGAVSILVIALVLQVTGSSLQAVVAESFGKDPTLTDRTFLWDDVIRIGMKSPLIGSGYGGFWVDSIYSQLSDKVDNRPMEAHNGYLETFANLGFIGLGLLACVIIRSIASAARTIVVDFEYGCLRLSLLIMVVVMNWSEATFPRGTHLWWYGFLVVAVYAKPWVNWPAAEDASEHDGSLEKLRFPRQEALI
jgi:O-antigen ligase